MSHYRRQHVGDIPKAMEQGYFSSLKLSVSLQGGSKNAAQVYI